MKREILRLLKETDGFISSQSLCEQFQVSRTAIWKVVEQLKKEGYQIQATRNRGYHLIKSPDILSAAEIGSRLHTKWAGHPLVCYEETDSTNNQAKAAGEKEGSHGTLFVADKQTAGKGRRGRSWDSPSGSNIYMTLLLRPDLEPNQAAMLTQVMGLSVAEAIEGLYGCPVLIKWPNDVILNDKKVCGILTEMSAEMEAVHYVVIGVGINVGQETFPEDVGGHAGSLKAATGKTVFRAQLIADVLERFEKHYGTFVEAGDLKGLQSAYANHLVNIGRQALIQEPGNQYEALAEGIDERGRLLVSLPDGTKRAIYAGEVSVRGIYGYV